MNTIRLRKDIYWIENFWSPQQCDDFINRTKMIGYAPATVQTENGPRRVDSIRNNNRVMYTDFKLAHDLWVQLQGSTPLEIGESVAVGLNERFRFYEYQPGQHFRKHRDQSYIRNKDEASYFTFMIYLNDNFKGGATTFNDLVITPQKGAALIFYHYLEHEGSEVLEGIKYILRTDIMYKVKNRKD